MTNPNNAIGTNGAFGGRTSVNAFNDDLSAWSRGVMSGWACVPDSGMTVALGGDSNIRDVAVAVDDAGNRTSINNISQAPVKVTIPGAPASNTRIDSIVAYVDNPPQGSATITDNYESCGIIVVSGTATANPVAPNESTIRTAITADGATGATAYYVVLANVRVASGTTDITAGEIEPGDISGLVGEGIVKAENIDFDTVGLGEVVEAPLTVTLPTTAYNGTNVILSTGSKRFSGGVYMLSIPTFCVALSNVNYQANLSYRIDNGSWETIRNWAYWENGGLVGSIGATIPVSINSGNHTIEIGVGTNSGDKRITVSSGQIVQAFLTKVGV
jgi:hypothetical protein